MGFGRFVISDGSSIADPSMYAGLRVSAAGLTMPSLDQYVRVTGVSSCFKIKSGDDLYRLIRVRDQADIVVLE